MQNSSAKPMRSMVRLRWSFGRVQSPTGKHRSAKHGARGEHIRCEGPGLGLPRSNCHERYPSIDADQDIEQQILRAWIAPGFHERRQRHGGVNYDGTYHRQRGLAQYQPHNERGGRNNRAHLVKATEPHQVMPGQQPTRHDRGWPGSGCQRLYGRQADTSTELREKRDQRHSSAERSRHQIRTHSSPHCREDIPDTPRQAKRRAEEGSLRVQHVSLSPPKRHEHAGSPQPVSDLLPT